MITNKHIKELEKQYIGKKIIIIGTRVVLDEKYNGDLGKGLTGVITEVSPFGQLKIDVDGGGFIYLNPEDEFHMITE